MNAILLKPVLKTPIWGTEQWGISAHPNGDSEILENLFGCETLSQLWDKHPELFGNVEYEKFPLLTKIIDAKNDLSIQVHPDDDYARKNEKGSLGKQECWYVMDAESDTTIIIGHNAKTRYELNQMVENGRWSELVREFPVHKGDFFFIEPGTVHAIKGGTVILETQQSSDITYRFYDYGRLQNGKPRPLHIKQCLEVVKVPYLDQKLTLNSGKSIGDKVEQLVSCDSFTVWHANCEGKLRIEQNRPFLLCSVIGGECCLNGKKFSKFDHFILPFGYGVAEFSGKAELVFSSI